MTCFQEIQSFFLHSLLKTLTFLSFQLAADAENPIPMTQEEKVRIESLLGDLDELPEITGDEDIDVRYKHAYIAWK